MQLSEKSLKVFGEFLENIGTREVSREEMNSDESSLRGNSSEGDSTPVMYLQFRCQIRKLPQSGEFELKTNNSSGGN
jgi:hypothetical protein